jgi:hypothetical protein
MVATGYSVFRFDGVWAQIVAVLPGAAVFFEREALMDIS